MDLGGKGELFAVWGDIKFFFYVCFYISSKRTGFSTDLFAICIILYLIGIGNRAEKCIVWAMCLKESHGMAPLWSCIFRRL